MVGESVMCSSNRSEFKLPGFDTIWIWSFCTPSPLYLCRGHLKSLGMDKSLQLFFLLSESKRRVEYILSWPDED
jgi:hypothetical protein